MFSQVPQHWYNDDNNSSIIDPIEMVNKGMWKWAIEHVKQIKPIETRRLLGTEIRRSLVEASNGMVSVTEDNIKN